MTDEAPAYPSPDILDSRRLFGANLFHRHPGAVLEVEPAAATDERLAAWCGQAQRLATALGWAAVETVTRVRPGSAQCFLTAPAEGLMTATLVAEQAWVLSGAGGGDARAADMVALLDSLRASLRDEGPESAALARPPRTDLPITLVTGSNGKTTTTRLVAAMWRAAGRHTGWCCSDGVFVGADDSDAAPMDTLATGDYTGPAGARLVLDDPRVEAAVLETARGGMLRRGLAMPRADVAVITNISADHFGEYGVASLDDLAEVKGIVSRVLDGPVRTLVLNAGDPTLVAWAHGSGAAHLRACDVRAAWWAVPGAGATAPDEAELALVESSRAHGAIAAVVSDGMLRVALPGAQWLPLVDVAEVPLTFGGRARHNVANLVAATVAALAGGVPMDAVRAVLRHFGERSDDNPGRLMVRRAGGVTVFMDYAHNPDGVRVLCETAAAVPATRRLLLIGQAGNRDDAQLRALAESAWRVTPFDRVILKEMADMRRGRAEGEIPARLREGFLAAGAAPDAMSVAPSEVEGVREALAWARAGDVLVLGTHVARNEVVALVDAWVATRDGREAS